MRTTLDIDDDVLSAAKDLAAAQKTTAGKVISELARKALTRPTTQTKPEYRSGLRLMPPAEGVITPEMIDRLREDDF